MSKGGLFWACIIEGLILCLVTVSIGAANLDKSQMDNRLNQRFIGKTQVRPDNLIPEHLGFERRLGERTVHQNSQNNSNGIDNGGFRLSLH